jgi:hypothetical protein
VASSSLEEEVPASLCQACPVHPSPQLGQSFQTSSASIPCHYHHAQAVASPILWGVAQTEFTTTPRWRDKQSPLSLGFTTLSSTIEFTAAATLRSSAEPSSRSASVTGYRCSVRALMCASVRAITSVGSNLAVGAPSRCSGSRV